MSRPSRGKGRRRAPEQAELSFLRPTDRVEREREPNGEAPPDPQPSSSEPGLSSTAVPTVFRVADVVRAANRVLEHRFTSIWVEGEVVGLNIGSAGHAYFTLKDESAVLPTAMWRSTVETLKFELRNGQVLRVHGRLGIFSKQGRFQLYADKAEPTGLGALMLELEQRKQKLAKEGLFALERKRALPRWPRGIGVVTSAHGAAIHDVVKVARRRCPSSILLSPAVVQGPQAPRSLRAALARIIDREGIDVIIIGRGGGAMEDLWAFNDEALARDIAACPVPIVSAVGHEVDTTICDLVADVRAATPSHAAELVVPDRAREQATLDHIVRRIQRAMERVVLDERARLEQGQGQLIAWGRGVTRIRRQRLAGLERALAHHHPHARVARDRKRLEGLLRRLVGHGGTLALTRRERLERLRDRLLTSGRALPRSSRLRLARAVASLNALSPLAVLQRGYAVVTDDSGQAITQATMVPIGDTVHIRLSRGRLAARVERQDDEPEDS